MKDFSLVIKNNYFFIIALLLCAFAYYFYSPSPSNGKICFNEQCFLVEMAVNEGQRQRGLAGRDYLSDSQGMLFVFNQEQEYGMWMKNMKIPLDMIFLDKSLSVVSIAENLQPCQERYCPTVSAGQEILYVLEIKAGLAEKEKIKVGQKAEFSRN